jgi:hypothetical protein
MSRFLRGTLKLSFPTKEVSSRMNRFSKVQNFEKAIAPISQALAQRCLCVLKFLLNNQMRSIQRVASALSRSFKVRASLQPVPHSGILSSKESMKKKKHHKSKRLPLPSR